MKAYDVMGWTYEADAHCWSCARKRFGKALNDDVNPPSDREGNEVHPVFAGDDDGEGMACGDCGDEIFERTIENDDE